MMRIKTACALVLFSIGAPLCARDVIVEFKGAYFAPTNGTFRDNYPGGALFGPELTLQLWSDKKWYGFVSIDYFKEKGRFLSLSDSKKLTILPLGVGLKYIRPVSKHVDFYIGLGFQPVYLRTRICRGCVTATQSRWAFGGIGKMGAYINLPRSFVIDLFVDYAFAKTSCTNFYSVTTLASKAKINGAIFGAGLGYRF